MSSKPEAAVQSDGAASGAAAARRQWNPLTDWKHVDIPWNPHLYRISHQNYHHRYTLYQGSDGEDVPNFVNLTPRLWLDLFFRVLQVKALFQNLGRLFTLKPTSKGWRGRGYRLDAWEQFILFAAIPCYNLKKFSRFVADQLPPKERAWPRVRRLDAVCREKYGSWQYWRDHFGFYKGV